MKTRLGVYASKAASPTPRKSDSRLRRSFRCRDRDHHAPALQEAAGIDDAADAAAGDEFPVEKCTSRFDDGSGSADRLTETM